MEWTYDVVLLQDKGLIAFCRNGKHEIHATMVKKS